MRAEGDGKNISICCPGPGPVSLELKTNLREVSRSWLISWLKAPTIIALSHLRHRCLNKESRYEIWALLSEKLITDRRLRFSILRDCETSRMFVSSSRAQPPPAHIRYPQTQSSVSGGSAGVDTGL